MSTTWIVVLVLAVLALFLIGLYNSLIRLKNRVDEAWSDIEVQLKRRHDLIPNILETVKAYGHYEQSTFTKVVEARQQALSAQEKGDKDKLLKAEDSLSAGLKSIFALAENYPDLKANQNYLNLQEELTDTEDKIMAARRFYNGNVRDFNTKLQVFPSNIFAQMLNFQPAPFFEAEEEEKEPVKLNFN